MYALGDAIALYDEKIHCAIRTPVSEYLHSVISSLPLGNN
jgi:hypothetical protein